MVEYKFVSGQEDRCEKTLNEWSLEYDIQVISMVAEQTGVNKMVTILLRRTKK